MPGRIWKERGDIMPDNGGLKQKHKKKHPQDADSMASQELFKKNLSNEKDDFEKFVFKRSISIKLSKNQSRQHNIEHGNELER